MHSIYRLYVEDTKHKMAVLNKLIQEKSQYQNLYDNFNL